MRDTFPTLTPSTGAVAADDRLLIPAQDAARMLGISERTLFAMTAPRGPIVSVRIGRADSTNPRVLYSVETLKRWITAQTASTST